MKDNLKIAAMLALVFTLLLLAAYADADELSETARLAPKYNAAPEVTMPDGTRVRVRQGQITPGHGRLQHEIVCERLGIEMFVEQAAEP